LERSFTALHYAFDRIPHFVNVDCALASDRPARLVADRPVVAPRNKLCVAVYDEIRVVAGEYELSLLLRPSDLLHDFEHHRIVEVLLGLVDDQRWADLIQKGF
jgi:hypothetical protein